MACRYEYAVPELPLSPSYPLIGVNGRGGRPGFGVAMVSCVTTMWRVADGLLPN